LAAWVALGLSGLPGLAVTGLTGQEVSAPPREVVRSGYALATLGVKATKVRSRDKVMLGGNIRILFSEKMSGGLGIWVTTAATAVPGGSTGVDYAMDFAYGGAVVERSIAELAGVELGMRLTVGAGSARMTLPGVSGYTDADNFGVVVTESYANRRISELFSLQGHFGYRYAFGVDDLPQTISNHFRAMAFALGVVVGPW